MKLVAKEFVASRDDEEGVLILSTFAGASRELAEAILVNPYDTHTIGTALEKALTMPVTEQRERLRLMRDLVRVRNVHRWAGQMLIDAARFRSQQRIAYGELAGPKRCLGIGYHSRQPGFDYVAAEGRWVRSSLRRR